MPILTALATASAALSAVKALVNAGREVEDCAGQLGKWFSAVSDIRQAQKEATNPPLFRKLLYSGSVEEEALQATIADQKLMEQERELRELIMYRYGDDVYLGMIQTRRKIREQRERTVYRQKARRRAWRDGIITVILIGLASSLIGALAWLIITKGR